jgi:hypothetical protein
MKKNAKPVQKKVVLTLIILFAVVLGAAAAIFTLSSVNTYIFTFYSGPQSKPVRERRRLNLNPEVSGDSEAKVRAYVEEYLLGPATLESAPLFYPGTKLITAFLRGSTLYVNLSREAAMPPLDLTRPNISIANVLSTFQGGIMKNFPAIKNISLYIEGIEI